jgi:hypothetical protein
MYSPVPGDRQSLMVGRGDGREAVRQQRADKNESIMLAYSARGIRGPGVQPSPHWLAHLLINEAVAAYRTNRFSAASTMDRKVRTQGVALLRDVVVRHAYDVRYQSKEAQHRLAGLFLPLLGELIADAPHLANLPHDDADRKEWLALFLAVLQDLPPRVAREFVRLLCQSPDSQGQGQGYGQGRVAAMPVTRLFLLLHLVLDTFEYPLAPRADGDSHLLSESIASSGAGAGCGCACGPAATALLSVTAPTSGTCTDHPDDARTAQSPSALSRATANGNGSGHGSGSSSANNSGHGSGSSHGLLISATSATGRSLLGMNTVRRGPVAKLRPSWPVTSTHKAVEQPASPPARPYSVRTAATLSTQLLAAAARNVSKESCAIVVQVVVILLDECPAQLLSSPMFDDERTQEGQGQASDNLLAFWQVRLGQLSPLSASVCLCLSPSMSFLSAILLSLLLPPLFSLSISTPL